MSSPNYVELTRFLMEPLLDSPEHLKVSTEVLGGGSKVWVRVALSEEADRGRFFGRGGRNIQAVRNILKAAGDNAEQKVTLEVFGAGPEQEDRGRGDRGRGRERRRDEPSSYSSSQPAGESRSDRPKPKLKLRKRNDDEN